MDILEKHKENKKALEKSLRLKFFQGRDADWGSTDIMIIKGNEFAGIFVCDLAPLTGEQKLVVMCRVHNPQTQQEEDTDIIDFNSETDDVKLLIEKLDWV